MEIYKDWSDFKTLTANKVLSIQYEEDNRFYHIFASENGTVYRCDIFKENPASADQTDFEDNFQADANAPHHPVDEDGKPYSRAESRPLDMTTYFTTAGDNLDIGDDDEFLFDFNNTDNDVGSPPSGRKQKEITFSFIDAVRIKEGTIYWENMPYGSHMTLSVWVPDQGYYKKNDGTIAQNTTGAPLEIDRFVNKSPMMGDCPMGDELNTEAASSEIPAGMLFKLLCDVPDSVQNTDNVHAAVQVELYRRRTRILT